MARTAVPITKLDINAGTALGTMTNIDATNHHVVNAGGDTQRLLLYVSNSAASDKVITVKAGANPPAFRSGLGDLSVTVAASGASFIVIESARFAQSDGSIYVDIATGMTGEIGAFRLDKAAS